MKHENIHNLPDLWVKACEKDTYSGSHENGYSVTELLQPTKYIVLKRRHYDDLTVDVKDKFDSVLGTAVHGIIENALMPQSVFDAQKLFNRLYIDQIRYNEKTHEEALSEFDVAIKNAKLVDELLREQNIDTVISEKRYSVMIDDKRISGGVDIIDVSNKTIIDIKTCSTFKYEAMSDFEKWTRQLNAYRYMVEQNEDIKIDTLKILVIMKDWKRGTYELAKTKNGGYEPSYPSEAVRMVDIPVHDYSYTLDYWATKIEAIESYKDTPDDEIPECPERWEVPTKYRLMKDGRKSALAVEESYTKLMNRKKIEIKKLVEKRVKKMKGEISPMALQTIREEEEEAFDETTWITKEVGVQKRCEWYCDVKHHCDFYRNLMKERNEEE